MAATGPRGLKLAARHGQAWVTTDDPKLFESGTPVESRRSIGDQIEKLGKSCADIGRDSDAILKILLTGFTPDRQRPVGVP